ncbi:hypothetical protein SETIT_2G298900v2 [Setaria italica]|uniref:Uncharacterized protein n=2 Tax=Setaria TaxID=4554 RepID=A0A368Q4T7_SETIT|nr:hypothetical protein SETIT_2G298900v2 [Setaria italica]RCV12825.1 hypothetical protein SETIT_2G298900v2 [Setaria italica]
MSLAKRYVLRLFISLKYVTANVVDRQSGRIVTTASTAERPLRDGLECGRACNAKAAAAVGEVLAMRLKVDGLAREPIHADAAKEVAKKGFKNQTKVWAILNALRNHGVNLHIDDDGDHRSQWQISVGSTFPTTVTTPVSTSPTEVSIPMAR